MRPREVSAQPDQISPRRVRSRGGKFENTRSAVALRLDWEGGGPQRTAATRSSGCGGWGVLRLWGVAGSMHATSPGSCTRDSESGMSLQCKNCILSKHVFGPF